MAIQHLNDAGDERPKRIIPRSADVGYGVNGRIGDSQLPQFASVSHSLVRHAACQYPASTASTPLGF